MRSWRALAAAVVALLLGAAPAPGRVLRFLAGAGRAEITPPPAGSTAADARFAVAILISAIGRGAPNRHRRSSGPPKPASAEDASRRIFHPAADDGSAHEGLTDPSPAGASPAQTVNRPRASD